MSAQLTVLVPMFDGTGYTTWARAMKAFLQSQGLFGYANGDLQEPAYRPAVTAIAFVAAT